MSYIIEAVFEEGVFKPKEKLDIASGERVRLIVKPLGIKKEDYLKKTGIENTDIVEFDIETELRKATENRAKEKRRVG